MFELSEAKNEDRNSTNPIDILLHRKQESEESGFQVLWQGCTTHRIAAAQFKIKSAGTLMPLSDMTWENMFDIMCNLSSSVGTEMSVWLDTDSKHRVSVWTNVVHGGAGDDPEEDSVLGDEVDGGCSLKEASASTGDLNDFFRAPMTLKRQALPTQSILVLH